MFKSINPDPLRSTLAPSSPFRASRILIYANADHHYWKLDLKVFKTNNSFPKYVHNDVFFCGKKYNVVTYDMHKRSYVRKKEEANKAKTLTLKIKKIWFLTDTKKINTLLLNVGFLKVFSFLSTKQFKTPLTSR